MQRVVVIEKICSYYVKILCIIFALSFHAVVLAQASQRLAKKETSHPSRGIEITNDDKKNPENLDNLELIARKVGDAQLRVDALQQEVLAIQRDIAAKLSDVLDIELSLVVNEPSAEQTKDGILPLAVQEISVDIEDVPLVTHYQPTRMRRDEMIPLYFGPMPLGEFSLRVRAVIGILPAPWPAALPQGRWLIDEKIELNLEPPAVRENLLATKPIKVLLQLNPAALGKKPRISLWKSTADDFSKTNTKESAKEKIKGTVK